MILDPQHKESKSYLSLEDENQLRSLINKNLTLTRQSNLKCQSMGKRDWLNGGDLNIKFFMKQTAIRAWKIRIPNILDDRGNLLTIKLH